MTNLHFGIFIPSKLQALRAMLGIKYGANYMFVFTSIEHEK